MSIESDPEISCLCGKYTWSLANPREHKLTTYHCTNSTNNQVWIWYLFQHKVKQRSFKNVCRHALVRDVMGPVEQMVIASRTSNGTRHMLQKHTSKCQAVCKGWHKKQLFCLAPMGCQKKLESSVRYFVSPFTFQVKGYLERELVQK